VSYDLALWDRNRQPSLNDIKEKYVRFCESQHAGEKGTGRVSSFFTDLEKRYPSINDYAEDRLDECPWACPFEICSDFAVVCMRWSSTDAVMPIITELARAHGLVCYDPQEESVHYP
jgi:hypothetical protein